MCDPHEKTKHPDCRLSAARLELKSIFNLTWFLPFPFVYPDLLYQVSSESLSLFELCTLPSFGCAMSSVFIILIFVILKNTELEVVLGSNEVFQAPEGYLEDSTPHSLLIHL